MVSTIKRVSLVFFCVLVALTSFIFTASAVDSTYEFNIPDPALNADGYLILPVRWTNGSIPAQCIWWEFTCNFDSSGGSDVQPIVYATLTDTKLTLSFATGDSDKSWLVNVYTIFNGSSNTNNISARSEIISYDDMYTYTWTRTDGSYFKKPTMYSGISDFDITSSSNMTGFTYDAVFSGTNPLYTQLKEVNSHFTEMLIKADLTNEQLSSLVETMNFLYETVSNIDSNLYDFIYCYWDVFQYGDFPIAIDSITSRLDKIYDLLNKSGSVEQTTVNSDKVDEFADIEQSLLNNDNADNAINDMDVSIDGQAYSFIWDLITDILNTHPEVFGLVITILTLGFLALILNR